MLKKRLVLVVSGLLLILLISLLSLGGMTHPSDIQTISDLEQKDTLQFTSSWAGYDTNALPLKDVLTSFGEANPDIELVDESMAGEDFLFTLKTDFASGNEPDVFGLWPGSDFDLLVKQGKVADLTPILESNKEWYNRFHEDAWKYVTVDNKIYGLPFEIIYEGLFVNVDLFAKYHIAIPKTYEELKDAVDAFNAVGIIPIAYNTTPEGSFIYQNIVMKLGGKEDVEQPFDSHGNLRPAFSRGMDLMKELYDMGAFPDNAFLLDDKSRNDLFMNKEAAMIVQGTWFIGEQGVEPDDTSVAIVPFPSIEGGKAGYDAVIYGMGNGIFHMSSKAWNDETKRENSIKLLQSLTSVEAATRFKEAGGFISNIKIPFNSRQLNDSYLYELGQDLIESSDELVGPTDSFIDRNIWENVIVDGFPDFLTGKISERDIIDQVKEAMKGTR